MRARNGKPYSGRRPRFGRNGRPRKSPAALGDFYLYVEGPRDRDILRVWTSRMRPDLGRNLAWVILGGRQPERARSHFRAARQEQPAARALCVLDRDTPGTPERPPEAEPGLEFFIWGRRHIESYLLVPDAIRRSLRLPAEDHRVVRACRQVLPEGPDENTFQSLDAKRLLAQEGELARALGAPLRPGRIARAMRETELHPDIRTFFRRVEAALSPI